jgi:hypothetical protein
LEVLVSGVPRSLASDKLLNILSLALTSLSTIENDWILHSSDGRSGEFGYREFTPLTSVVSPEVRNASLHIGEWLSL